MTNEMNKYKNSDPGKTSITNILKVVATLAGALALFIPLMTGIFQYRQSVQQELDKSFRTVVESLSSEKKEERLAAASSIGTFINKGEKYYQEAIDILINRLSIELNYNVLNAIKGSLEKIAEEEYKKAIKKLLDVDRNLFIQQYALETWRDKARKAFYESKKRYQETEFSFQEKASDADKEMLKNLKVMMNAKWEEYQEREDAVDELSMHKQVISDFLSIFLSATKFFPIEGLEFFRNSMYTVSIMELNFIKSTINRSNFSSSNIWDTNFDGSTIANTFFSGSSIKDTKFTNCKIHTSIFTEATLLRVNFSGSEFKEVFFAGSDLTGTHFEQTTELKPIYFYKAKNLDKAIFAPAFKRELESRLAKITNEEFTEYVTNNTLLDDSKKNGLLSTLSRLNN